ncbi:phage tail protein [Xanthobacter sediminis]
MTAPTLGIINQRLANDTIAAGRADFSKLLAIDVSTDADVATFPIGQPVRFSAGDPAYVGKLGTGPLADAVAGAQAQLGTISADTTVIRVAAGEDEEETASNIITAIGSARGIPAQVNATPRLIHVGGTEWVPDDNHGNPVVEALPALLEAFRGFSVVQAPSDSLAHAVAWREKVSSQRIHGIASRAEVWDATTSAYVSRPAAAHILGLAIRKDLAMGGYPMDTLCNEPIYGIGGVTRPVAYSLEDGATEGQQLLAADLGILVTGQIGVDQSIADGGFTYLGFSSCGSSADFWSQYHQLRSLDYITVEAMKITREILGRRATPQRVESWILSLRSAVAKHVAESRLLGGKVDFPIADADAIAAILQTLTGQTDGVNTVDAFRNGELLGLISIEPAPVIKVVTQQFRRYRQAVEQTLANILAAVSAT